MSIAIAPRTQQNPATTTGAEVLKLQEITLEYPDGVDENGNPATLKAIDQVSFTARRGTVSAIVGASGSGKSSLLSVAATLIQPTSGNVILAEQNIESLNDAERTAFRARNVGIIFQQPNLLASLTALEQLTMIAHMKGARGAELAAAKQRAAELLDIVGLSGAARRRPHQLSGGQRQRVNIARALMGSPSLLLADEPTSALDQQRSEEIVALLAQVTHEFNLATVMVTHDMQSLENVDSVLQMSDGRGGLLC